MVDVRLGKLNLEFSVDKLASTGSADKKKMTFDEAMALAIYCAYQGSQCVAPNPMVGCVILDRDGYFLSKGFHEYYGGPHAEINALKNLNTAQLTGATMVVTLEPCAHVGKTGSCALLIKDLPVSRVVYGIQDPNPLVSGKGAQIIVAAGKKAILFSDTTDSSFGTISNGKNQTARTRLLEQLEIVAENFLKNFRLQKPFVALKWAQSLDGKIALQNFESQWITNNQSRNYAHYLRSIYDVTLVGAGTILNDNPKLNIRLDGLKKENKILILDPDGIIFLSFENQEISKHHKSENVYFVIDSKRTSVEIRSLIETRKQSQNVLFLNLNSSGQFHLEEIHNFCFERKMKSILVEGGAFTLNRYLESGSYDRAYCFIAPVFMGNGLGYSDQMTVASMDERQQLRFIEKVDLDDDILVTGIKKN